MDDGMAVETGGNLVDFQIYNFEVFNLPQKCNWKQLRDLMTTFLHPSQRGLVLSVRVYKDQEFKWAVCAVRSYEIAVTSVGNLNGLTWFGSTLAVSNIVPQYPSYDYYYPMYMPMYGPGTTTPTESLVEVQTPPNNYRYRHSDPEVIPSTGFSSHENVDPKKLFIGNIPFSSSEQSLAAFLNEEAEGVNIEVQLQLNGTSKGYAIASCASREDAERLIKRFDGAEFEGRCLTVRYDKLPQFIQRLNPYRMGYPGVYPPAPPTFPAPNYVPVQQPFAVEEVPRSEKDRNDIEKEEAQVARELVNALRTTR
ncbi:unnamed protein product [Kuraishia capsulata CBS 1993]|uniref:RRM domain-containing protein n=1 Tax=Kuraishia capsulata CBS 1993 TaxID=1382522 RepID=W6MF85_9ASCO|nr:uncharacterized protein KUCA_T00000335001 [Kuraishia capsulata CBS 1993]CDK24374.1 unnamed protein product [Kuraishia capsulata CBS 1993]